MTYNKYFLLLFFIPFISFSQVTKDNNLDFVYNTIEKGKTIAIPPGTIKLNDSIYIDRTPVNNAMYNEFFENIANEFWSFQSHDIIKKFPKFGLSKELFKTISKNTKRDSSLLQQISSFNNQKIGTMSTYDYLHDSRFMRYPIVNITKDHAEIYCKWRTDMVKLLVSINYKTSKERTNFPLNFHYRLATPLELENALSIYGYTTSKVKPINEIQLKPTSNSFKGKHNKFYFIKNNISEYTTDNKFGKGYYTGFRCVCEVEY